MQRPSPQASIVTATGAAALQSFAGARGPGTGSASIKCYQPWRGPPPPRPPLLGAGWPMGLGGALRRWAALGESAAGGNVGEDTRHRSLLAAVRAAPAEHDSQPLGASCTQRGVTPAAFTAARTITRSQPELLNHRAIQKQDLTQVPQQLLQQ